MNMTLNDKLEIIAQKFTYKPSNYILLQDCNGWTDTYIADLTGDNIEIQAKVKKMFDKGKTLCQYTIDKENCPKIASIKPELSDMDIVTDIEPVFRSGMLSFYVYAKEYKYLINGELLSYFVKKFIVNMGFNISLYTMKDKKIIAIVANESIIGLLMPMTDYE